MVSNSSRRLPKRGMQIQAGLLLSTSNEKRRRASNVFFQGNNNPCRKFLQKLIANSVSSAASNGENTEYSVYEVTCLYSHEKEHKSQVLNASFYERYLGGYLYDSAIPKDLGSRIRACSLYLRTSSGLGNDSCHTDGSLGYKSFRRNTTASQKCRTPIGGVDCLEGGKTERHA